MAKYILVTAYTADEGLVQTQLFDNVNNTSTFSSIKDAQKEAALFLEDYCYNVDFETIIEWEGLTYTYTGDSGSCVFTIIKV